MSPFLTLIPLSLAWGGLSALTFRRFSNPRSLRAAVNRILAHVLELRLFLDEPKLILRAQRDLLRANVKLLQAIAIPTTLLAIPMLLAFAPLDDFYGYGPLTPGQPVIVTAKTTAPDIQLEAPSGVAVETPPVRALHAREISWRIRPQGPVTGPFTLTANGRPVALALEIPHPRSQLAGLPWWLWFTLFSAAAFRYFA